MQHYTYSQGIVYLPVLHDAVSATATSVVQLTAGAKAVMFEFTATGTRQGVWTVTVSSDGGTNYRAYSMLISNAANTNSQTLTRVASLTTTAAQTDIMWMDPATLGGITHIKVTITISAGTGTFTGKAAISY